MTAEPSSRPLLLLDTTGFLAGGSMSRYLQLLSDGIQASGSATDHVRVLPVGLPADTWRWLPSRFRTVVHHLLAFLMTAWATRRLRPALVHVIDGSHAYLVSAVPASVARVVTVHDLIPLLQAEGRLGPQRPSRLGHWLALLSLRALARADHLMADSAATLRDLAARSPAAAGRCSVVHLAVRVADGEALAADTPQPYLLHVGNNGFYKNRDGLLRIFVGIARASPVHLMLVGPELSAEQIALLARENLSERVQLRSHVKEAELSALYRNAEAFIFPSLYEGYGWPPLEAMALGCPVICSDRASLPELVGDAAVLCDPEDEPAFVGAVLQVLREPARRSMLRERGRKQVQAYSLQTMTQGVLATYAAARAQKLRN